MKKRVRTLLRVSSKKQLRDDDIPIQRKELEQFLADRKDWMMTGEYLEKAVSGYKNSPGDREILRQILNDARDHQFDILLCYMSDRIGRQDEYSYYVSSLNEAGIEVWTVKDGQLKTEDHIDKLLNFIRFWQNEGESRKTGERVRDAQIEMIKAGKFTGGKSPYGYRLELSGKISSDGRPERKLVICPEEAEIVKEIYRMASQEGLGYQRIANRLNERKIRAPEKETWGPSTIAGILKNTVYMGFLAYNRRNHDGKYRRNQKEDWIYAKKQDPSITIISEKEWRMAEQMREKRRRRS